MDGSRSKRRRAAQLLTVVATLAAVAVVPAVRGGAATPPTPQSFTALATGCTASRVTLTWVPYTFPDGAPAATYKLTRDGKPYATVTAPTSYYIDTAVGPGEYHAYTLAAFDAHGGATPPTAHTSAITDVCGPVPRTKGALRVAVFVLQTAGITPAAAGQAIFTKASNVYRQASWGQTWLTGDVFGPLDLEPLSRNCDIGPTIADARKQAGLVGTTYDYYVVFAGSGCYSRGWQGIGAFLSQSNHAAHELGHVMGMQHASTSRCAIETLTARTCKQYGEYGSRYDFMGNGRDLNAPHKESLGWLDVGGTSLSQEVSQNGTFTLAPLDAPPVPGDTRPRMVKVLTGPVSVPSWQKPAYISFEYRQGVAGRGTPGVMAIHMKPVTGPYGGASAGRNYLLLGKGASPYLRAGAQLRFTRDGRPVTVKVVRVERGSAELEITFGS